MKRTSITHPAANVTSLRTRSAGRTAGPAHAGNGTQNGDGARRDPAPKDGTPVIDERYASYRLTIAPSKIHRWGVYAGEFIPANRKIIEYTGERCNRRETKKRAQGKLNYLFTLNEYWCLDGAVGGSGAEFINHCCRPNVYAKVFKGHILYMSRVDILPGEELTIDYRFDKDVPKVSCKCGASNCRGTINLLD